jgi:hypothetical protein
MLTTYNINDTAAQERLLREYHVASAQQGRLVQLSRGLPTNPGDYDIELAVKRMKRKVARHRGEIGKYAPHQGAGECRRRAHGHQH